MKVIVKANVKMHVPSQQQPDDSVKLNFFRQTLGSENFQGEDGSAKEERPCAKTRRCNVQQAKRPQIDNEWTDIRSKML